MTIETQEKETVEPDKAGRGYWILAGATLGFGAALVLAFIVLIAGSEPPVAADPVPDIPESGADQVTIIGTEFAFEPSDVVINSGATIDFDNEGVVIHNIEVDGIDGFLVEAEAGQSASGTLEAAPGEYVMFCSIPGHREAGMEGTLTVATGG